MIANSPQLQRLRAIGEVRLFDTRPDSGAEKIERVRDATVILNSRGHIGWSENDLRRLPHLKLISLASIGTDCVDLNAANNYGVTVCNVPGRTARVVAEHAFCADVWRGSQTGVADVRHARRKLVRRYAAVARRKDAGRPWHGKYRLRNDRARTRNRHERDRLGRSIRITKRPRNWGSNTSRGNNSLSSSDVLSVHVKLTDDSRHLLSGEEISKMKPGSILINTARGGCHPYGSARRRTQRRAPFRSRHRRLRRRAIAP